MKSLSLKFLYIIPLFIVLLACNKEEETPNANNTPVGNGNWDMKATLTKENGEVIDFHCNFDMSMPYSYPYIEKDSSNGSSIILIPGAILQTNLVIIAHITGPGDYNFTDFPGDEIGGNIDLNTLNNTTNELEHYMNYDYGSNPAILHVISLSNNHIKATFSGKLYEEGGNKVITITNGTVDTDLSTDSY